MPSLIKSNLTKSTFVSHLVASGFAKPRLAKVVFGVAAVSLTLGAAQFASGHDLAAPQMTSQVRYQVRDTVNRAGKADRAVLVAPGKPTQTIGFRPGDLPATSVLVRIPLVKEANDTGRPPLLLPVKASQGKPMVACEPVVSVLTEVARKLQPGRCVT